MSSPFILLFLVRYILNKVFGRFYEFHMRVCATEHYPVGWASSSELESKREVQPCLIFYGADADS